MRAHWDVNGAMRRAYGRNVFEEFLEVAGMSEPAVLNGTRQGTNRKILRHDLPRLELRSSIGYAQ